MKKMKMAAFAFLLVLGSLSPELVSAQYYDGYDDRNRDLSYQDFYDDLSPYGRWVEYPGHGYVWVPDAGPDFQPYSTNGHWVWTEDYEWMWVSDYDWGWAPFHYGRWDYDDYYGWYWVPGYEWSPAWVAWRDGGDYYGWAPIRPGISISINFNIGGYNPPYNFWCFAPRRYINSPRIYDYYVDRSLNINIIRQTTIIVNNYHYGNNYGFRTGPRRYDAEIYCGRINPVRLRDSYSPGRTFYRNNEVNVFRPRVRTENNRNIAPRQFERYDRNNGGFRNDGYGRDNNFRRDNGGNNNRRPDERDRVDNNRNFDRRMNNGDNNAGNRGNGNNFPGRNPDNNGNRGRDDNNRIPGNNPSRNADNNGGGFRRDDNPNPGRNTDNTNRPMERSRFDRNENNNPGGRPADRRVDNTPSNPGPSFDPGRGRPERNPDTRTDNNRFERRNMDNNPGRQYQPQQQPQQQPRMERPQQQPRMERPQQQPQQRNFERRSDDGGGGGRQRDGGGNNGGGNGRGRGRF